MKIEGINGNITFAIHPSEPLGKLTVVAPATVSIPKNEISVYFKSEALRRMRREISRILLEVELIEKKEREDELWAQSST